MAKERSELEQRRAELTRSLPALSDNRANTYRRNSDAKETEHVASSRTANTPRTGGTRRRPTLWPAFLACTDPLRFPMR
jgi:hypothetical protein